MPPRTRQARSQSGPSQPTLAFGTRSRVSKPTRSATDKQKEGKVAFKEISPSQTPTPAPSEPATPAAKRTQTLRKQTTQPESLKSPASGRSTPEIEASTQSQNAINAQARSESKLKSDADRKAEAISEAQIKSYWREIETSRLAPQIHQEGVDMYEKILRHFDLSQQYGPCVGIARIKRWRRAERFKLSPPIEVLAVLLRLDAKGQPRQRAYLDELLS
ncbi:hypothetical protein KEM55_002241 [Ascosphaera atra]|nr:hypothetical protein KEM55_002241 [Ascosphaera atra]